MNAVMILNYGKARRRRWKRVVIPLVLMLVASTFTARHWLAHMGRELEYNHRWERCVRCSLPSEMVVYDEQPDRAKRLLMD